MIWLALAYALVWLSCASVSISGMYIFNNAHFWWIMIIPLFVSISQSDKKGEK